MPPESLVACKLGYQLENITEVVVREDNCQMNSLA